MKGTLLKTGTAHKPGLRASRDLIRKQNIARAVAAPELSPKEAGTHGASNQLAALKQMSKIVADSGVSPCLAQSFSNSIQS